MTTVLTGFFPRLTATRKFCHLVYPSVTINSRAPKLLPIVVAVTDRLERTHTYPHRSYVRLLAGYMKPNGFSSDGGKKEGDRYVTDHPLALAIIRACESRYSRIWRAGSGRTSGFGPLGRSASLRGTGWRTRNDGARATSCIGISMSRPKRL
jgi:hypothetical protein